MRNEGEKGGNPCMGAVHARTLRGYLRYRMWKIVQHYYETVPRRKHRFVPVITKLKRGAEDFGNENSIDLTPFGIEDYEDHPYVSVRWRVSMVYRDKENGNRVRQSLEGNISTTRRPLESMIAKGELTASERYEFDYVWSQLAHLYDLYKDLGKTLSILEAAERNANQRFAKTFKQSEFRKHLIEDFNANAGEASIDPESVLKPKSTKNQTQEFFEDP